MASRPSYCQLQAIKQRTLIQPRRKQSRLVPLVASRHTAFPGFRPSPSPEPAVGAPFGAIPSVFHGDGCFVFRRRKPDRSQSAEPDREFLIKSLIAARSEPNQCETTPL